ncbi:MAG: hypothetical protein WCI22_14960 [Actinomycetota bacterium]
MQLRRLFPAALVSLALFAGTACNSSSNSNAQPVPARWGALSPSERATYDYIVPYGTSVRIDSGQKVNLMPKELNVKVGESIRINNQDTRDYMIGPFFVTAGQSLAMRFTQAGVLSGQCSMTLEGVFTVNVRA